VCRPAAVHHQALSWRLCLCGCSNAQPGPATQNNKLRAAGARRAGPHRSPPSFRCTLLCSSCRAASGQFCAPSYCGSGCAYASTLLPHCIQFLLPPPLPSQLFFCRSPPSTDQCACCKATPRFVASPVEQRVVGSATEMPEQQNKQTADACLGDAVQHRPGGSCEEAAEGARLVPHCSLHRTAMTVRGLAKVATAPP